MLAHGFTNAMLDPLVRDGLAIAERWAVRAGRAADPGYLVRDHRRRAAGACGMMRAAATLRNPVSPWLWNDKDPRADRDHHGDRRGDGCGDAGGF
jgi:hypothetical protein